MTFEPLITTPPTGTVAPSWSRDLTSPEGNELEVVDAIFARESSNASFLIPK